MPIRKPIKRFISWVLQLHDTPESIALGTCVGLIIGFTPLFGFHIAIAITLSLVFRMNRLMALAMVQVTNFFTAIPLYYMCYRLGALVLGMTALGYDEFSKALHNLTLEGGTFWHRMFFLIKGAVLLAFEIAGPLWVGGLLVGGTLGALSYYLTRWFVRHHRLKLAEKGKLHQPL